MTLRSRHIWTVILAAVLAAVLAVPASAKEIVIPALSGRVVDQAAVLSTSQESDLTRKLAELERKTTAQLVVVTLKSLQGRSIEEWGLALGRGWKIGQAGKNNGLILVVAPAERELRIEVGYGLEGVVTDAEASAIIRNVIVPRFKAGNMYGGISDGVDAIARAVTGEAVAQRAAPSSVKRVVDSFTPHIHVIFFLAFFVIVTIVRIRRRGWRRWLRDAGSGNTWYVGGGGSSWGGGSSGGGFSGGGGSFGGGGSSGRW
jgi:uncharacterized protein